jgi:hypothetical protein
MCFLEILDNKKYGQEIEDASHRIKESLCQLYNW